MQKLLFVVVLAAASFAGGAAVHSRGPRWAKELIQGQLGVDEAGAPTDEGIQGVGDPPEGGGIPSEPLPPLGVEPSRPKPAGGPSPTIPPPPAAPEPKAPEPLDPGALGLGDATSETKPPILPTGAPAPPLLPSPLPPSDGPPALEGPAAGLPPKGRGSQAAPTLPRARRPDSIGDPANPPTVPAPDSPAPIDNSGASPGGRPPADWAELRRSMRVLGVSRFGIEGEPGGRVRFHCLIPLAGRRAVAQHFEAEADDEFRAAEAALRRVTLWRATEGPRP